MKVWPAYATTDSSNHLRVSQIGGGRLYDGTQRRVTLELTDEAANLFHEWRLEHFKNEPPSGLFASHYGKMPGIVLRIALVLEHLWWSASPGAGPPKVVSLKAVAAVAGLVTEYFLPMARRCYGDAALPDDERGARTILNWIIRERETEFNASNLRRSVKLPGLRTAPEITAATDLLEEAAFVRPRPSRSGNTKGRAKADFVVNPKLWAQL